MRPVSLVIARRQSTAGIGPSGAGKSTRASIIGALQPANCGGYRFDGRDVGRSPSSVGDSDGFAPRPLWNAVVSVVHYSVLSLTAKPVRTLRMTSGIMLAVTSATAAIMIADTQQVQIDRRFDLHSSATVGIGADSAPDGFDAEAIDRIAELELVTSAGELSIWADDVTVAVNSWSEPSGVSLLAADRLGTVAQASSGADPHHLDLDRPLA